MTVYYYYYTISITEVVELCCICHNCLIVSSVRLVPGFSFSALRGLTGEVGGLTREV